MEEDTKTLADYLDILRRRKWQMLIPAALLAVVAMAVAFSLPPTYRSQATVLIEEQEIPKELVLSTVTSYADQRVQVISQRVMTRSNLWRIAEQFDLYPEDRRTQPQEVIISRLRENISLEMVSADVVDPRSGRPTQATIAFTLAYEAESPQKAQRVTNELASLFLNENIKSRREQAAETSNFFADEAQKLSARIAELESQLADFKQRNAGNLPELTELNLSMLERTDRELMELERQISSLQERRIYLEAELSKVDPQRPILEASGRAILSPGERLKALQSEYISAKSKYSESHPDMVRMRSEIAALEEEVGPRKQRQMLEEQLTARRDELKELRRKYSDDHPDVKHTAEAIGDLHRALRELPEVDSIIQDANAPDNPTYITLKAQLETVNSNLRSVKDQRRDVKAKAEKYERRLARAPQVEREYRSLTRDYENAVAKYRDIKAKQMEAQVAQELEQDRKGERFTLIEPPQLPERPDSPNRPAILFLGLVVSAAGGLGIGALAESLDRSVRGVRGVAALLSEPPLGVIPYIENAADRRRRRLFAVALVATLLSGAAAFAVLVHMMVMPLDVLWFALLRKLGV